MKLAWIFLFGLLFFSNISCVNHDAIKLAELKDVEYKPKDLYKIKVSSFQLKSKVPGNKNVTCYYTRPYRKDGSLAPRADTVVYYAHYPMEKNYYKIPKKNSRRRIFIDLARRSGFTVFSVDFTNSPIRGYYNNPKGYYCFPSSGSSETVLKAYDMILKKEKMPFTKFFMTGLSAGPTMSVNFANTYPDKVDALALQAGRSYIVPVKKNTAAWLIMYTLYSMTTKKNEKLAADLRNKGKHPIVVRTMPNWQIRGKRLFNHCENWNSTNLRNIFLEDVADLRSKNNNVMPPENKWPYVISMSNKSIILKNKGQKLAFKDPLYMPSLRFYKEYMKVVPDPLTVKLDNGNKMLIGVPAPACEEPKGIIIDLSNNDKDMKSLGYDARYFAENAYMYLTAMKYCDIEVFKKILAEKFASLSKTAPVFIVADDIKIKNFDIKNLSKLIIFCNSNKYFANIKEMLKNKVKVTLIVHDKKLLNAVKKELGSLVNVIYVKPVSLSPIKAPFRAAVFCKDQNEFPKMKALIKEFIKEKMTVFLFVDDKKFQSAVKKEFKKSLNRRSLSIFYNKQSRKVSEIFFFCNQEKDITKAKAYIRSALELKMRVVFSSYHTKILDIFKKEFKDSIHYVKSKVHQRPYREMGKRNNNKAILKALNNIPAGSIEERNKKTTLSP